MRNTLHVKINIFSRTFCRKSSLQRHKGTSLSLICLLNHLQSCAMSEFITEIVEVENLLAVASFPGVKAVLQLHLTKLKKAEDDRIARETIKEQPTVNTVSTEEAKPVVVPTANLKGSFIPIENFAWDQSEQGTVSVFIDLDGVGTVKDKVVANFTNSTFDVTVTDLNGKNYRLVKDNLEKDIVADKCKCVVKNNKIVLKLQKKKGEYSFDHWTSLTAKKKRGEETGASAKKDPMGGVLQENSKYVLPSVVEFYFV